MRLCDRENAARARLVIPTRIRLPQSFYEKKPKGDECRENSGEYQSMMQNWYSSIWCHGRIDVDHWERDLQVEGEDEHR